MKRHLLPWLGALALITTTAPAAPNDGLTTYGKTLFGDEINHGPQVTVTSLFSAAFTTDTQGRVLALNSLMGDPGKFSINDALTGKALKVLPLGDKSAGSYATLVHSSGDIYLSSHPHGHLYRYHPGADKLDDLGLVNPTVKFIWEMEEIAGGKILMACYPKSKVIEFDPATSKFTDLGSAKEGEDYARAIAYDAATNQVFVGVGSHPALISWDLATGKKEDILPEVGAHESTVYNVDVVGDKLITRLSPSVKGLVFDVKTHKLEDTIERMEGNQISALAPDGESYFFTIGGKLMRHNLRTKAKEEFARIQGNSRGMGFATIDGHDCVLTDSWNGTIDIVDLQTRETTTIQQTLPSEPIAIHNMYGGPDNRLYSSGYVAGALGIFDPATSQSTQIDDVPQLEGGSFAGNTMYLGTYPRARIYRYEIDPAKLSNVIPGEGKAPRKNPKELFRLEEYHQDRPYGMLGIEETGQCVISTIPDYGKLGGLVCVYNDKTGEKAIYKDLLGKRSGVSLAQKDGIVYIGTTISGGLGIPPAETEGTLVGMDLKTGKKLFEVTPVKDARIIGDIAILNGKLWGWAEGTLFSFNLKTRQVEKTFPLKKLPRGEGHIWRGARFTQPTPNGKVYAVISGALFELDPAKETIEKIATDQKFSTLSYHKPTGSLYFGRGSDLIEWKAAR